MNYNSKVWSIIDLDKSECNLVVHGPEELAILNTSGNCKYVEGNFDTTLHEIINGEIVDRTTPYVDPCAPSKEYIMRHQRDELLKSSDWTQVPDAPVDQAAWQVYRQALRDITLQEGFPTNIIWPQPPQ